jgi:regulator of sigma E protease
VWQRFLVVLAGPAANFVLAVIIFAVFFAAFGVPRSPNVVGEVKAGSPAAHAGLRTGDRITSVDGNGISSFEDLRREISLRPRESVPIIIVRDERQIPLRITLGTYDESDEFGQHHRVGQLGVLQAERVWERPSPLMIVPEAVRYTAVITRSMAEGLWQIVTGRRGTEDVGGPIKIAQIAGQQASLGALPFVQLLALFSINLGFINLLPVPMLDGGHLLFYAVEAVRRRPLSARALDLAFRGGLALILALVLFTTLNDLGSLGLWDRLQRLIG